MTTINNEVATKHTSFSMLRMVVDANVGRLESIVQNMYKVTTFDALPQIAQEAVIYLCYMELNKTTRQVCDMYNLTVPVLKVVMQRVQNVVKNYNHKDDYVYQICMLYRASFKMLEVDFENVESVKNVG